jgi:hypothetical protein
MHPGNTAADRRFTLAPQRRKSLRGLRELWWSHDRRRQLARLADKHRRHPLDEGYVVDAMAHQIEEIRNLPEVGR